MVMHARSGGNMEVMGLLLGKVDGNTMIVMDGVALPVEGTETRVNAQAQAYEYMACYTEAAKQVICGGVFSLLRPSGHTSFGIQLEYVLLLLAQ